MEPINSCPTGLVHLAVMGVYSCLMFPMEETISNVDGLMNSMFCGIWNVGVGVIINCFETFSGETLFVDLMFNKHTLC